jgi:hypothetical protein
VAADRAAMATEFVFNLGERFFVEAKPAMVAGNRARPNTAIAGRPDLVFEIRDRLSVECEALVEWCGHDGSIAIW